MCGGNDSLPDNFNSIFSWKGIYRPNEENTFSVSNEPFRSRNSIGRRLLLHELYDGLLRYQLVLYSYPSTEIIEVK